MIYLLDKLDPELFDHHGQYINFQFWETHEEKVKGWIRNERSRSIIDKNEVVNLFNIKEKIQMAAVTKIQLKKFDKVIVWTEGKKYFVWQVIGFVT